MEAGKRANSRTSKRHGSPLSYVSMIAPATDHRLPPSRSDLWIDSISI